MRKKLYTTSEYIDSLHTLEGNTYTAKGTDFVFFDSIVAADYDAQWRVNHYKKEGQRVKKPILYRVRFERIK